MHHKNRYFIRYCIHKARAIIFLKLVLFNPYDYKRKGK